MNKNILSIGLFILLPLWTVAQDFTDALRYSSVRMEGTARAGGMGNAFGALGGDFTGVGINPAGLGVYRKSEFSVTPNFGMTDVQSVYLGNSASDNNYKLGFNNFSYVGAFKSKSGSASGLISVNFGFGFNRLKDFNTMSLIEGSNAKSSFMDYIADNANRNDWSDFYEELAWETDLLLHDTVQNVYWHDAQDAGYGQRQQKSITKEGSLDEYTLAFGLNFSHKFYLGASLGINDLFYREISTLREMDDKNKIPYMNEFSFSSQLRTYGTGYNIKLGAIYKPVNQVRLGFSIATPTFFNLSDRFETSMESSITYKDNSTENYNADSPLMDYDYDLVSPYKINVSAAVLFGSKGLVSADWEYLDYSIAKLRNGGDGYDFITQNEDINQVFKKVSNLRLGGEFKVTNALGLRAGYELYPSAYNKTAFDESQPNAGLYYSVASLGLGYTSGGFFIDMAWRLSMFSEKTMLYPAPKSNDYQVPEFATLDNKNSKVLFTLGFRF
jgi:hypothetical protein